jgi:hypothetical protein
MQENKKRHPKDLSRKSMLGAWTVTKEFSLNFQATQNYRQPIHWKLLMSRFDGYLDCSWMKMLESKQRVFEKRKKNWWLPIVCNNAMSKNKLKPFTLCKNNAIARPCSWHLKYRIVKARHVKDTYLSHISHSILCRKITKEIDEKE